MAPDPPGPLKALHAEHSVVRLGFKRLLLWGIPAVALHNAEEALTMPAWLASAWPMVTRTLGLPAIEPPAAERLYAGLLVVTIVPALAVLGGARGGARSAGVYGCLVIYGIFFWNALVPHVALTSVLGSYTPGVVTALLVNIPYTVYLFHRALRDGQATRRGLILSLGLAAILYPLALLALWLSQLGR